MAQSSFGQTTSSKQGGFIRCNDGFLGLSSEAIRWRASSGTSRWVWRRVLACGAARGAMSLGSDRGSRLGGSVLVLRRRGMRVRQGKQRSTSGGADNEFNG
ncbi:hypothetical protein FF2_038153 [Malus domestica]